MSKVKLGLSRTLSDFLNIHLLEHSCNSAFNLPNSEEASYTDIKDRSKEIADFLSNFGLHEGGVIAICAGKSIDTIVALFGAILNNNPYVPIDSLAPPQRWETILRDCKPQAIVFDSNTKGRIDLGVLPVIEESAIPNSSLTIVRLNWKEYRLDFPKDLAVILYTSGSTGIPKGVMITDQNALSFINWASATFDFSENDIFSSVAPLHFDLSVLDLFVAIRHGAKVILLDEKAIRNPLLIAQLIEEQRITVWYSTPTVLMLLMRYGKMHKRDHTSINKVFYAGEVFPVDQLAELKKHWPKADFYNLYGPTETNVCTWFSIPKELPTEFSAGIIGQSCSHVQCEILNESNGPDSIGELIVSGSSVSPGYLNRPDLNTSRFYKDSLGKTWYKTGDWVERLDSGDFKFLGRIDRMIKRRGYRIELDEIEAVLSSHAKVYRAAVNSQTNVGGEVLIQAYIQASESSLDTSELKKRVINRLPSYMMPDQWFFVDQLPLTDTQKVNYKELKLMALS